MENFNPQIHQKAEEGYVKKETAKKYDDAKLLAEIANTLKMDDWKYGKVINKLSGQDVLQSEANSDNERLDDGAFVEKIKKVSNPDFYKVVKMATREQWANKEVVLAIVARDGHYLSQASEELKNDRNIVITAVKENGEALAFASNDLRNDKEIILEAINSPRWKSTPVLEYVSQELRNDKEIMTAAIKRGDKRVLDYMTREQIADKDLMLLAVQQDGNFLQYVSDELKNDRDVVRAAIVKDRTAFEYASDELKTNKEFVIETINVEPKFHAGDNYPGNLDAETSIRQHPLVYTPEEMKNDLEVILAAVQQDKRAIKFASKKIQEQLEKIV